MQRLKFIINEYVMPVDHGLVELDNGIGSPLS